VSHDVTSPAYKTKLGNPTAKSVLVVLADAANPEGFGWPSVSYMAAQTELSERQVMRIIQVFQEIQLIEKLPGCAGKYKYAFQINMKMLGSDLSSQFGDRFQYAHGQKSVSETHVEIVPGTPVETVPGTEKSVPRTEKSVPGTLPPHPLIGRTVIEPLENHSPYPPQAGGLWISNETLRW
jgi:Helix-turn-helix domain